MTREERAMLLLEQEETLAKMRELNGTLQRYGQTLQEFIHALSKPSELTFMNAPAGHASIPLELINKPSYDWSKYPKLEEISQKIQDLRATSKKLKEIGERLQQS